MPRVEYSELLGQLRTKLVRNGLLDHSSRRQFLPDYIDNELAQRAIRLCKHILMLQSEGFSPEVILSSLKTPYGIQNLEFVVMRRKLFPVLNGAMVPQEILSRLDRFPELQFVATLCSKDPSLQDWIAGKNDSSFDKVVEQLMELHEKKRSSFKCLSRVLEASLNHADLLTKNFTFQELFNLCSQLHTLDVRGILIRLFLKKMGKPYQKASWGQMHNQLDFILQGGMSRAENEKEWELLAASGLYAAHLRQLEPSDLGQPELRKNAGGYLLQNEYLQANSYKNVLPDVNLLNNESQADHFDYLEDPLHPLSHLLATFGVEVELLRNPFLNEKYDLISEYVSLKGTFDYEFSAKYVRHIETLTTFYQKLFDSGMIDLLILRDDSVHWNVGTHNKELTIKTFSMMLLTGLASTGRISESIFSKTNFHDENGGRFEWKHGNLLHSECFLLAANVMHSLVTAQKAFEQETLYSVNQVRLKRLKITEDQIALAQIYETFMQKSVAFLKEVSAAMNKEKLDGDILYGSPSGMRFSADVLLDAFPTIDSFIDIDPAVQLEAEATNPKYADPEQQYQHEMSLYIVAKSRELTLEAHHQVRKVLAEAEEAHTVMMLGLAKQVLEVGGTSLMKLVKDVEKLILRFPNGALKQFVPGQVWTTNAIAYELVNRFHTHLKKPGLSQDDEHIFRSAIQKMTQLIEKKDKFSLP